jgi:alkaline phosphatase D
MQANVLRQGDCPDAGRRRMLRALGGVALAAAGGATLPGSSFAQSGSGASPFTLGVASGDPAPDGFVLWTKLAPQPLARGGGMRKRPVEVEWTVADDERMTRPVQRGRAVARPEVGHAVHVEVAGLQPARDYFYRFTAGGEQSRIGRTRTLPAPGAAIAELRFAAAGCQRYEEGYFTAWRRIAEERFDFVFHYGDYIYERAVVRPGDVKYKVVRVMPGDPDECFTLDDYRHRYALYQLDPDLQAAQASAPFVVSFDDHEVENNWGGEASPSKAPREYFLLRRAAAFQAWYEHMPLRRAQLPRGPDIRAFRQMDIGNLVSMHVLDTRQHRSEPACTGQGRAGCPAAHAAHRTMLGEAQERWLHAAMHTERSRWTLLAQQVPMFRRDLDPDPNVYRTSLDKWDGAVAARERLYAAIREAKRGNVIVVSGDVHLHCAAELKQDFDDPASPTLGVEFVATSVTSNGDGYDSNDALRALLAQDPHIKFYNRQRGYVRHVVTPERWRADFQVLDRVSVPDATLTTRQSFVVEHGRPGLLPG